MNPGLNPALSVELGKRALLALLAPEDRAELLLRDSYMNPVVNRMVSALRLVDHFILASDKAAS